MTRLSFFIFSGEPSAINSPWAKQNIFCAKLIITRMLCSITSKVIPNSLLTLIKRSIIPLINVGLIPAVGSSSNRIFG